MKENLLSVILIIISLFATSEALVVGKTPPPKPEGFALVPFPESLQMSDKPEFRFNASSRILYETRSTSRPIENSLEPLANVLAGELELVTSTLPPVIDVSTVGVPQSNDIVLRFDTPNGTFAASEDLEDQSYTFSSNANGLEIRSAYYKGVAYGTATLIQAMKEDGTGFHVPAMDISDSPEAAYRAIMLDVARQVHSIGVIKDVVRMARLFKIRYLHLHLTDDQNFTFPFPQVTDNISGNFTYTLAELQDLVSYADARGVTLIPEMDLPGHSSKLKKSGYLNPSGSDADVANPANYANIQAIIDSMLTVFVNSPYFHIGGDESAAGSALEPFLAAMNEHLRDSPPGGKRRMLVWEGFGGAPTTELPATGDDRIIVLAWESTYNAPWDLLNAGYQLINASWKPMYVVGGGSLFHPGVSSGRKWKPEMIHSWNKNTFMHWEPGRPVYEDSGPSDPDSADHQWNATYIGKQDQVIGGQLLFWEQTEQSVINQLTPRISAMSERLWNPSLTDDFAAFSTRENIVMARVLPIVQPIEILPKPSADDAPVVDSYQPYTGSQQQVTLRNRTRVNGTIRYETRANSGGVEFLTFPSPDAPDSGSIAYGSPFSQSGGFSVRAQLFRQDGTAVDGSTWSFFANFPNRVQVTDYDIGEIAGSNVPDMKAQPAANILDTYQTPYLRGPYENIALIGQLQLADLTPPGTGDYVIHMKTQSGHASLYLDLDRDGNWDPGEKLITDTPNNESRQNTKAISLQAGVKYPLRVDHKSGLPRPALILSIEGPGIDGLRGITPYLTLPQQP